MLEGSHILDGSYDVFVDRAAGLGLGQPPPRHIDAGPPGGRPVPRPLRGGVLLPLLRHLEDDLQPGLNILQ